jgi:hypothetical protein
VVIKGWGLSTRRIDWDITAGCNEGCFDKIKVVYKVGRSYTMIVVIYSAVFQHVLIKENNKCRCISYENNAIAKTAIPLLGDD